MLAKSYFDFREYDRAAHFTKNCISKKAKFLHYFSKYSSAEIKKKNELPASIAPAAVINNDDLKELRVELECENRRQSLDGFGLYLYGVVLKKLDLTEMALGVLLQAIESEPLHWGSWMELVALITNKKMLRSLKLPDRWIREFFMAYAYLELHLTTEALSIYNELVNCGFAKSTYVMAQLALCHQQNKDADQAEKAFQNLQKEDPFRLDDMDTYSNLLYNKKMTNELGSLSHRMCKIDRYRVETICVIGNFYSLRCEQEKALWHFHRAVTLNPNYLSAWTLLGHEYLEIGNTSAAIQSYRRALDVRYRDYRAWHGLGHAYEMLEMYVFSLYYFRQAQQSRPNDSMMFMDLGAAYENLDKFNYARKCYLNANFFGGTRGLAFTKLINLHIRNQEKESAALFCSQYVCDAEALGLEDRATELWQAHKFLAEFYLEKKKYDKAYTSAKKCMEFKQAREAGAALLKAIAKGRAVQSSLIASAGKEDEPGPSTR